MSGEEAFGIPAGELLLRVADSVCEVFCELPDTILSLTTDGNHLYAETASGIYQICQDGSVVGVNFGETK